MTKKTLDGAVERFYLVSTSCEIFGSGGLGWTNPDGRSGPGKGGNGAAGRVVYTVSVGTDLPADVVPLNPTATGTFVKTAAAGQFPDPGPGLWVIWTIGAPSCALMGVVPSPGVALELWDNRSATFFASQRVTYAADTGTRTIGYAFYALVHRDDRLAR